jgi:hypothetical protein
MDDRGQQVNATASGSESERNQHTAPDPIHGPDLAKVEAGAKNSALVRVKGVRWARITVSAETNLNRMGFSHEMSPFHDVRRISYVDVSEIRLQKPMYDR